MIATDKAFQTTDELFRKIIPLENFNKEIILIDEDNAHKDEITHLLKNDFYPYLRDNVKVSFMDVQNINFDIQNRIICVPIAFENINIRNWVRMANNNIVIAAMDEEYIYPWSLSNVIPANHYLHWAMNINDKDTGITGTSVYCAFLSILALNGKDFLLNYIKEVDKNA